ncbi:2-hydroxychromene-2-carboxylate isomerase [Arenimonas oryziterrae]|uniref:2-hydroxychromene-2-carboxylate isomerase n=1 Tax=Arenimonas oryziterrae DSM 21050 = YC6267 TaxID=1121015 RepID=A0A091ASC2_9GAMM|nr:2-hydroxychromene-2-carboxylate isomerase [Arenimonas oryziterrae]KFN42271.1 hypothetical protein N789_14400 [Arenimonas oryziterrae DSM 21050 = YC6267]
MDARWYFDFISPFAYLQWPKVRALAERQAIAWRPLLFAGLLDHLEHKGPAEIPAKRLFTYRHVTWLARQRGVALRFPPAHPFNPLLALRLCVAANSTPTAIGAIFDWIWGQGRAADSLEAIAPLAATLGIADPAQALSDAAVKTTLRQNFDEAVAAQVFGVPTLSLDGQLFWGDDAFDFATAFLADPGLLSQAPFHDLTQLPIGSARR